jgi:choline kinase
MFGILPFISSIVTSKKMNQNNIAKANRITTALLLAAGTGSRLLPLTKEAPKCLTMVSEISILARLVENLRLQGFKKLVVVTGHLSSIIEDFLGTKCNGMDIEYLHSPLYKTTNNIYSLWMVREKMTEPFVLIESDLVFNPSLLDEMVYPDRVAVASIDKWMNGTTVIIDENNKILEFNKDVSPINNKTKYKTVNIYSFSCQSWEIISERLNQHIIEGKVNGYYETVFSELVSEKAISLESVSFDKEPWYEIDNAGDLAEAVKLFPLSTSSN